jgi:hypothetical protein
MVEMREKRAEREAAKEAAAAAKAEGGEVPPDSEGDAKAVPAKKGGGRRGPKKPAPTTARTKRARSKT